MEIEQVVEEKRELQKEIRKLIVSFQDATHTKVTGIGIQNVTAPDPVAADKFITVDLVIDLQAET